MAILNDLGKLGQKREKNGRPSNEENSPVGCPENTKLINRSARKKNNHESISP